MIWTIIIAIVAILLFSFLKDANKDNTDLQNQILSEKFKMIVLMINETAFKSLGAIHIIDKRQFNIYKEGENQIIQFFYSTGHLTILWKYKYFQKEIEHKKVFRNVRNLSTLEQQKIADIMITEMNQIIINHQNEVLTNNRSF